MADKTRARDNSSLHKCRIELPNLIDDLDLGVYEFRLYVHLKRVAGENGSCWQSTRTLAAICNMSPGQISKSKDELERRGLIIRQTKAMQGGQVDDITIVDLWPENFQKYAPGDKKPLGDTTRSDRHTNTSQPEVIATRTLPGSDRHTNTSGESDQDANTSASKRSRSERKKYSLSRESHDPPPPPAEQNGGGGDSIEQEPPNGKPNKTELYHWLRANGVDSPQAAERNQHHDLALTQAMFRRLVGESVGDERKKRIGRFIRALEADGPPPARAPTPAPIIATTPERPPDLLDPREYSRRMASGLGELLGKPTTGDHPT